MWEKTWRKIRWKRGQNILQQQQGSGCLLSGTNAICIAVMPKNAFTNDKIIATHPVMACCVVFHLLLVCWKRRIHFKSLYKRWPYVLVEYHIIYLYPYLLIDSTLLRRVAPSQVKVLILNKVGWSDTETRYIIPYCSRAPQTARWRHVFPNTLSLLTDEEKINKEKQIEPDVWTEVQWRGLQRIRSVCWYTQHFNRFVLSHFLAV